MPQRKRPSQTLANGADAAGLVDLLTGRLLAESGPTLIQAGHFSLVYDLGSSRVLPGVPEELEVIGGISPHLMDAVRRRFGRTPCGSWTLGVRLASSLRSRGRTASLVTLVNDWSSDLKAAESGAAGARRRFFAEYRRPLRSYAEVLREYGLGTGVIRRWHPDQGYFVSESWLRTKLSTRLGEVKGAEQTDSPVGRANLVFAQSACMIQDDAATHVLTQDGRADCLGEVTEFVSRAYAMGYRTIVNFVPVVCDAYVDAGSRAGALLFGLRGAAICNIAVGNGETIADMLLDATVVRFIWGVEEPNEPIEAEELLKIRGSGNGRALRGSE